MKVTIFLTESEVLGLKRYLKEVSHDVKPKITVSEIKNTVVNMVSSELYAGAIGDYINQAYKDLQNKR